MTKEDKRIELLNAIFDEEKRRTDVEKEAEDLFLDGKYEESTKVLKSLDDRIILNLREELKKLDKE